MIPTSELVAELRTVAQGLDFPVRFQILDACDRLERKTRDNQLLAQKIAKLRHRIVKSNADRIRAMSDEELAAFLYCFGCCQHCSEHERLSDNRWFSDERCDEMCVNHCLEWLKQPAEVDNG